MRKLVESTARKDSKSRPLRTWFHKVDKKINVKRIENLEIIRLKKSFWGVGREDKSNVLQSQPQVNIYVDYKKEMKKKS